VGAARATVPSRKRNEGGSLRWCKRLRPESPSPRRGQPWRPSRLYCAGRAWPSPWPSSREPPRTAAAVAIEDGQHPRGLLRHRPGSARLLRRRPAEHQEAYVDEQEGGGLDPDVASLIAFALAMLSLINLPTHLASYREQGILRRMSTTPVPPAWMLAAQVIINLALAVLALGILIVAGTVGSAPAPPRQQAGSPWRWCSPSPPCSPSGCRSRPSRGQRAGQAPSGSRSCTRFLPQLITLLGGRVPAFTRDQVHDVLDALIDGEPEGELHAARAAGGGENMGGPGRIGAGQHPRRASLTRPRPGMFRQRLQGQAQHHPHMILRRCCCPRSHSQHPASPSPPATSGRSKNASKGGEAERLLPRGSCVLLLAAGNGDGGAEADPQLGARHPAPPPPATRGGGPPRAPPAPSQDGLRRCGPAAATPWAARRPAPTAPPGRAAPVTASASPVTVASSCSSAASARDTTPVRADLDPARPAAALHPRSAFLPEGYRSFASSISSTGKALLHISSPCRPTGVKHAG
jgi:hypothetical protein